jgi:hypothetical protein
VSTPRFGILPLRGVLPALYPARYCACGAGADGATAACSASGRRRSAAIALGPWSLCLGLDGFTIGHRRRVEHDGGWPPDHRPAGSVR